MARTSDPYRLVLNLVNQINLKRNGETANSVHYQKNKKIKL